MYTFSVRYVADSNRVHHFSHLCGSEATCQEAAVVGKLDSNDCAGPSHPGY